MAIIRSKWPDINIPENLTWTEFVFQYFDKYGDRPAIIDAPSGRYFSFHQLKDKTRRFSSGLAKRGFKKGDVMAMYLPNILEYPIIFHGAAILGGTITTLNPQCSNEDLSHFLKISHAKYLVTTSTLAKKALSAGVLKGIHSVFVTGQAKNCESISSLLSDDGTAFPGDVKIDPKEDVVALPFSSGTTGVSKGVMLTHYNLIAQTRVAFRYEKPLDDMGTVINVLPFYHIYGLSIIMGGRLHVGSKIVALSRFEPRSFLRAIQDYKVTSAPLVPPLMLFLAKHPLVKKYDLSSLKFITSGAAPLSRELEGAVAKKIPSVAKVMQGYGMTELSGASHNVSPSGKFVPGSIGVLLPNLECKVIDLDTGETLGPNQDGEMCIRGPIVMKGYLDNPEATARTIDSDGWLHTGDIVRYDEDEYFFIVGRQKELIKYKGFQVPPVELEALLITHPNIDDVAVIGVPDLEAGELPKAFVVRRGNVTSEEIIEFVAKKVQPHKKLRGGVEFVKQIPKSASGKILRRMLMRREKAKRSKSKL